MKTLSEIQWECRELLRIEFFGKNDTLTIEKGWEEKEQKVVDLFSTSLKQLLEQVVPEGDSLCLDRSEVEDRIKQITL